MHTCLLTVCYVLEYLCCSQTTVQPEITRATGKQAVAADSTESQSPKDKAWESGGGLYPGGLKVRPLGVKLYGKSESSLGYISLSKEEGGS